MAFGRAGLGGGNAVGRQSRCPPQPLTAAAAREREHSLHAALPRHDLRHGSTERAQRRKLLHGLKGLGLAAVAACRRAPGENLLCLKVLTTGGFAPPTSDCFLFCKEDRSLPLLPRAHLAALCLAKRSEDAPCPLDAPSTSSVTRSCSAERATCSHARWFRWFGARI